MNGRTRSSPCIGCAKSNELLSTPTQYYRCHCWRKANSYMSKGIGQPGKVQVDKEIVSVICHPGVSVTREMAARSRVSSVTRARSSWFPKASISRASLRARFGRSPEASVSQGPYGPGCAIQHPPAVRDGLQGQVRQVPQGIGQPGEPEEMACVSRARSID